MENKIKWASVSLLLFSLYCGGGGGGGVSDSTSVTPTPSAPVINLQKVTGGPLSVANTTGSESFGSAVQNTTGNSIEFKIQNTGTAMLQLLATAPNYVVLGGTDATQFEITQQPSAGTVGTGTAGTTGRNFIVRFKPTSTGAKTATVSITSNDGTKSPYTYTITGTGTLAPVPDMRVQKTTNGTVPLTSGSGLHNFGSIVQNTVGTNIGFRVQNLGSATLAFTGTAPNYVTLSGANANQFQITTQLSSGVLSAVDGFTGLFFVIRFVPTSTGVKTATVSIANNDATKNPYTFIIKGTGTVTSVPEILVRQDFTDINNAGSFAMPDGRIGASQDLSFSVRNLGTSTLNLTGTPQITISGADASMFSVTTQPNAAIFSDSFTLFNVRFSPTSTGTKTAVFTVANNTTDANPYVFNITGVGFEPTAPCITIVSGNISVNQGTATNLYGTGVPGYYSSMIPMVVGPANPSAIFFARQTVTNANPVLAAFYSSIAVYNPYFDVKEGLGGRNFATMFPYGYSSAEFLNYNGTLGSLPTVTPNATQTIYADFTSPVSLAAAALSYDIVRGCHPRLQEERDFIPEAAASSTNGLGKVWNYRKKINVNLIFVQGIYPTYTVAGIQQAVDRMTNIYSQNSVKIDLQFTATSISAAEFQSVADISDQTGTLNDSLGRLYAQNIGGAQNNQALNIYITGDETALGGILGISSGIPGVPGITNQIKAGMVIFLEPHRSSGGAATALSAADLQFMGDTMAHEAAHYLGLFHTNEASGYNAAAAALDKLWGSDGKDALIETPYCSSSNDISPADGQLSMLECSGSGFTNSGALNLMFWVGDGVTAQTQVTGEQGWVLRSNPLAY
jgi:hypothetical protein